MLGVGHISFSSVLIPFRCLCPCSVSRFSIQSRKWPLLSHDGILLYVSKAQNANYFLDVAFCFPWAKERPWMTTVWFTLYRFAVRWQSYYSETHVSTFKDVISLRYLNTQHITNKFCLHQLRFTSKAGWVAFWRGSLQMERCMNTSVYRTEMNHRAEFLMVKS